MKKLFIGEELRTLQQKLADEKESESLMKRAEAGINLPNWKHNIIVKDNGEKVREKCQAEKTHEKYVAEKVHEKIQGEKSAEVTIPAEYFQSLFNIHVPKKGNNERLF